MTQEPAETVYTSQQTVFSHCEVLKLSTLKYSTY